MKVWVVMGNDFPEDVFKSEEGANSLMKEKMDEDNHLKPHHRKKIYWRSYMFELKE